MDNADNYDSPIGVWIHWCASQYSPECNLLCILLLTLVQVKQAVDDWVDMILSNYAALGSLSQIGIMLVPIPVDYARL